MSLVTSPRSPDVRPSVGAVHAGQTGQGGEQGRAQTPGHSVGPPQRRLLGQVVNKRHPEHQNIYVKTRLTVNNVKPKDWYFVLD